MGTVSSVYTRVLIPVTIKSIAFYMDAGIISRVVYMETNLVFANF